MWETAAASSRVKLVRQTEVSECGLACMAMVANSYGLDSDLGALRRRFPVSMRGTGLRMLIAIADAVGLAGRAVSLPLDGLRNLHLPAILHWNHNHFVVVERVKGEKALIHDPDGRSAWRPMQEISRHFTGVALELRPNASFEPLADRRKLRLSELWHRMTGLKRALGQTILLSLVLQVFLLAAPYYLQISIDTVVPVRDGDLLFVLAIGFAALTLMNAGTALLRAHVMLNASTSVSFGIAVNVVRKLFKLPIAWFERRSSGDVLSRFQSIGPIQSVLTEGAVASVIDGLLAIVTLAVMLFYSVLLTVIVVVAILLYAGVRTLLFSLQREAQEASIVAGGKEQTLLLESLRGMSTLRLFGHESLRHAMWQTRRAEAANADVRLARVGIWNGVANVFIFGLENVLTVLIAVQMIMNDSGFSIGMLFAFLAYRTQFIQRSEKLVDQLFRFRILGLHLERLSEIVHTDEDRVFATAAAGSAVLKGEFELRDVWFRYSPADPPVLKGVSLKVSPGEHIAITGISGGGKSTLMKLALGLLEPESGEILIDGLPLEKFGLRNYHRQVGSVMQEDALFAGSIAANIAFFEEEVDPALLEAAARAASIHDDVLSMTMGYETLIGDMGSTLSGGQKQRVLLARALYRQPRILFLDEGTSHLDSFHEQEVNRSLRAMDLTQIVVAHSARTIAAAGRIFHLADGKLEPGGGTGLEKQ